MKAPPWSQRVLLVAESDIERQLATAFGANTQLVVCRQFEDAVAALDRDHFHVMIIDEDAIDSTEQMFELSQYSSQLNHRLTIILAVRDAGLWEGEFARKCGASLIMNRAEFSTNRAVYAIRALRKRTFRTVLGSDLAPGFVTPVNLYHYLPMNNHYVVFLRAGEAYESTHAARLRAGEIVNLYALERDNERLIQVLGSRSHTACLASLRERFRDLLVRIFDFSTDDKPHLGQVLFSDGLAIARDLEVFSVGFSSSSDFLVHAPYPRWSAIAHSMNCGLFSILFAKACGMQKVEEIVFGAIVQNIGFCEVRQDVLRKPEHELDPDELHEYMRHGELGLGILRRKCVPVSKVLESVFLQHHEHYDGFGRPAGLSGDQISQEAALVSIAASYDHFRSIVPGTRRHGPHEAWQALKQHHLRSAGAMKFNPALLKRIGDAIFSNSPGA
ncbi:MAG: hypothetical protein A2X94_12120 [Bdellovibrionales bacterium GWB1_55_8]|nr:MAG: hypothetical protein A2X94_12120 [Bdellovibrionales bacterium GWB1_55_8]